MVLQALLEVGMKALLRTGVKVRKGTGKWLQCKKQERMWVLEVEDWNVGVQALRWA